MSTVVLASKHVSLIGKAPSLCVQLSTMLPQAHHWFVCPALLGHLPCTCKLGKYTSVDFAQGTIEH